jgi:hydrogenase-1 operon protein HyaE
MSTPFHPLLQQLASRPDAQVVGPDTLDPFLARGGEQVLFFSGDPVRFPEALDVAVVLPELQAACAGRFAIGVVEREGEEALARRFGQQRWPTLVFLRDGGYLGALSGMRDWDEYMRELATMLVRTPGRAPGIGIPLVDARAASTSCA